MSNQYENGNMANDAADTARSAVQMAADTARDVKTLTKAGANLAGGNIAGAAVEAAKNPGSILRVVAVILAPLLILILCLCSLPSMLWSSTEGLVATVSEKVDDASGATGNRLLDTVLTPASLINQTLSDWFRDVWGKPGEDASDGLDITANGVRATADEDAMKLTAEDLVRRTTKRYLKRYQTLMSEIQADSAARARGYGRYTATIISPYPDVDSVSISDLLLSPEALEKKYPSFFAASKADSARILAAYNVQRGGAIGKKVRWSEYSDWLGADNVYGFGVIGKQYYRVSGWLTDSCYWQGTFMNQRNYERMMNAMDKAKKASANPSKFDEDKWLQDHRREYAPYQSSVLNGFLAHDPAGPSLSVWTETVTDSEGKSHEITCCNAIYTIKRPTIADIGKDVMIFQSGQRDTAYDAELFDTALEK